MTHKTNYGIEAIWAETENYCASILVFEHIGSKTTMHFHNDIEKSWFVNGGTVICRWIDTSTGKLYEKDLNEGSVFHVPPNMPASLESKLAGSAVSQVSNKKITEENTFIIISNSNIDG
jgi:uncharacterized RmlC-like cupin family protein